MSKKIKAVQVETTAPGPTIDDPLIETVQVEAQAEPAPVEEVLPPIQTKRIRVYTTEFPAEASEIAVSYKTGERLDSGIRRFFTDFEVPLHQVDAFGALFDSPDEI